MRIILRTAFWSVSCAEHFRPAHPLAFFQPTFAASQMQSPLRKVTPDKWPNSLCVINRKQLSQLWRWEILIVLPSMTTGSISIKFHSLSTLSAFICLAKCGEVAIFLPLPAPSLIKARQPAPKAAITFFSATCVATSTAQILLCNLIFYII